MQIIAKKGVKLYRDFYIDMDIKPYFIPGVIRLPLGFESQKIELMKNVGDRVEKFDIIAYIKNNIPVYSSVSGKIIDFPSNSIKNYTGSIMYAVIQTDGNDVPSYPLWDIKTIYSKEDMMELVKKAAIVNESHMGYFVDYINLSTVYKKIIIDCVDDQPYDLSKTATFLNYKKEIIAGAEILAKAFNIPKIELLIMNNFRTQDLIKSKIDNIDVVVVKGKYPAEPVNVQYAHKNIALSLGAQCC